MLRCDGAEGYDRDAVSRETMTVNKEPSLSKQEFKEECDINVLLERTKKKEFESIFGNKFFTYALEDWAYIPDSANERLLKHFETKTLKGFGVSNLPNAVVAAGAILHYLDLTHHQQTGHITQLSRIEEDRYVWLDRFTVRNLELYGSMSEGAKTLVDVLDRTIGPMGARLLKRWVAFPLKDVKPIVERQSVS